MKCKCGTLYKKHQAGKCLDEAVLSRLLEWVKPGEVPPVLEEFSADVKAAWGALERCNGREVLFNVAPGMDGGYLCILFDGRHAPEATAHGPILPILAKSEANKMPLAVSRSILSL